MPFQISSVRTVSAVCLFVVLCFVKTAAGQSTFGSITGTVTDPTGAVVPGATIGVTNTQTQALSVSPSRTS